MNETQSAGARGHIHAVGVAGIGMSALAQVLVAQGHDVSGSDRTADRGDAESLPAIRALQAAGVRFVPQDGSGVGTHTTAVVVSSAIENDNPDIARAHACGAPIVHRAEMLARAAAGHCLVAVTGTSGKTTVTGMLGWILECAGRDPTVVNGGVLPDWAGAAAVGNARCGASDLWVIEADESDRSLLAFTPDWGVITNLSKDHFELAELKTLFDAFRSRVRRGVVEGDAPAHLGELAEIQLAAYGSRFRFRGNEYRLGVPGLHNVHNAASAIALCERLGLTTGDIRDALASFKGIHRRLEKVGDAGGIAVIDDYGHNPAKIEAAWIAVSGFASRVIGIWQPHGFGPLAHMHDELAETFARICRPGDRLFVRPVFYAGGTAKRSVDSDTFVAHVRSRGVDAALAPDAGALQALAAAEARRGDAILSMGARDPGLPQFARGIAAAVAGRS